LFHPTLVLFKNPPSFLGPF